MANNNGILMDLSLEQKGIINNICIILKHFLSPREQTSREKKTYNGKTLSIDTASNICGVFQF